MATTYIRLPELAFSFLLLVEHLVDDSFHNDFDIFADVIALDAPLGPSRNAAVFALVRNEPVILLVAHLLGFHNKLRNTPAAAMFHAASTALRIINVGILHVLGNIVGVLENRGEFKRHGW